MKSTLLAVIAVALVAGCATAPSSVQAPRPSATAVASTPSVWRAALKRLDPRALFADVVTGRDTYAEQHAKALAGDREAMFQVAQMFANGAGGVERDDRRMVHWLRQASQLDHPAASYHLYLHYLERGLDREAVRYETLAIRQGYVLPLRLDPRRG